VLSRPRMVGVCGRRVGSAGTQLRLRTFKTLLGLGESQHRGNSFSNFAAVAVARTRIQNVLVRGWAVAPGKAAAPGSNA
jgi:hypothetical protein